MDLKISGGIRVFSSLMPFGERKDSYAAEHYAWEIECG